MEGMRRLKARGVRVVPDPEHVARAPRPSGRALSPALPIRRLSLTPFLWQALIQDKGLQKEFFVARGIPTSAFALQQADDVGARGFPIVQKVRPHTTRPSRTSSSVVRWWSSVVARAERSVSGGK